MGATPVTSHTSNGVTTITIDRQEKLNALDADIIGGLEQAFAAAADDAQCKAVILTGAGNRAFVAGADIAEIRSLDAAAARKFVERGHALMARIEHLGKPVIAAINGFALGGGCELALACTLRIASDNAQIGLPEVKLGLIPGYGGTQRMSRLVGRSRALELMLGGDPIGAGQALDWGLVSAVVEPVELMAAAEKLATRLSRSAPIAMRCIIEAVNQGSDLPMAQALEVEIDRFCTVAESEDMREGTAAFLEKRRADFSGR